MSKYYIGLCRVTIWDQKSVYPYAQTAGNFSDPYNSSLVFFDSISKAKEFVEGTIKNSNDDSPEIILTLEAAILLEKELEKIQA